MNESIAITIMNDIISHNSTDKYKNENNIETDVLNRLNKWISMLRIDEITKLSYLYLSFIYEELLSFNDSKSDTYKIINEVKNNMKEMLFVKEVDIDISRYKAVIYIYMKYKKENKNLINL